MAASRLIHLLLFLSFCGFSNHRGGGGVSVSSRLGEKTVFWDRGCRILCGQSVVRTTKSVDSRTETLSRVRLRLSV